MTQQTLPRLALAALSALILVPFGSAHAAGENCSNTNYNHYVSARDQLLALYGQEAMDNLAAQYGGYNARSAVEPDKARLVEIIQKNQPCVDEIQRRTGSDAQYLNQAQRVYQSSQQTEAMQRLYELGIAQSQAAAGLSSAVEGGESYVVPNDELCVGAGCP